MATIGELVVKMRAESAVFSQQMDQVRRTTARTHQGVINFSNEGSRGMRKLENAAMNLSLGMFGLHGAAGKAAEGMLMLGVGGGVLTAVTIGLAGAGFLYEKLTKKTREAKEETDKFIESQLKAGRIRANPNAEILGGISGAQDRAAQLRKEIASMQSGQANGLGLDPFGFFAGKLAAKKTELTQTLQAIAAAQGSVAEKGFDLIKNLSLQAATFGMSTEAAQRYALAMDNSLEPSVRKTALALLTHIERLRENKEMAEAAAKAQEELTAKYNAFWDDIEAKANLAGPMVTKQIGDMVAAQKKAFGDRIGDRIESGFALAQNGTSRIERPEIFETMERNAEMMEETWKNSIRGIQEAFAEMFEDIGKRGFRLVSVLENIARAVQKSLAQLASQALVNSIFSGIGHGGGLPGAPALGDLGSQAAAAPKINPFGARSGTTVHVHQNVNFSAGFVDGASGEAWLKSKSGTIAGVIADAASTAPSFARFIVAQGIR